MAIKKPNLSTIVKSQLPEFVREDYQTFIAFIEAYYDFLKQNYDIDLLKTRDIDDTLDQFIKYFKSEYAKDIPETLLNDRFLITKIKDYYLAKGTGVSFEILLALLYGKSITIDYPSRQMLRASDGKWNQDVSVFARVNAGDPNVIVGRLVDVVTPTRIIRVQINKSQTVEIEVDRIRQVVPGIYEFYIDRRFFGNVNIGDRLRYADVFDATILPTTAKIQIDRPGKGFKIGQLYNITNGKGTGSVIKISRVNDTGGILACEFVKYGIGYENDFTSTLLPEGLVEVTNAGATYLSIAGVSPSYDIGFGETTDGFTEQGVINRSDYVSQTPAEALAQGAGLAWDGTYAGETVREFYSDNKTTVLDPDVPALIRVNLGPLTKYPGYYTTNDGFLSDAIYIQDSRYYQAFSYVLKIDERLENFKSVVKTLLHPAGMALFSEYDIRNQFDLSETLECMLKYLVLTFQDNVITIQSEFTIYQLDKALEDYFSLTEFDTIDFGKTLDFTTFLNDGTTVDNNSVTPTTAKEIINFGKLVGNAVLNDNSTLDNNTVTMLESDVISFSKALNFGTFNYNGTLDRNNVTPIESNIADISKPIGSAYLYGGLVLDTNIVTPIESNILTLSKPIDTHFLYDGTTQDSNVVTPTNSKEIIDFSKRVASTYLYDGSTLDDNTVSPTEATYSYGYSSLSRLGISANDVSKILDSTLYAHKLYDNATLDSDTFSLSDTTGSGTTRTMPYADISKAIATNKLYDNTTSDVNSVSLSDTTGSGTTRTMPYIVLNKSISAITLDYDGNLDNESVTVTAAGALWFNPYSNPYPVDSSYFLNDGGAYTTGESAFTG